MTGGRWLAQQAWEIERDREGATDSAACAMGGDPAHEYHAPSRYPLVWQLESCELVELAGVAGWSVAELIDHASRRPLV